MVKYLVFAWADRGEKGGWNDYVASFSTLSGAVKFIDLIHETGPFKEPAEFCHIVDLIDKRVMAVFSRGYIDGKWTDWVEVSE